MEQERQNMETESRTLLSELIRTQKDEARRTRRAVLTAVLALAIVLAVALAAVLPRGLALMDHMERSLRQVDTFVEGANQVLTENTDTVTEAVSKLNKLDFDALNSAIRDLSDAVAPMAELARRFR